MDKIIICNVDWSRRASISHYHIAWSAEDSTHLEPWVDVSVCVLPRDDITMSSYGTTSVFRVADESPQQYYSTVLFHFAEKKNPTNFAFWQLLFDINLHHTDELQSSDTCVIGLLDSLC